MTALISAYVLQYRPWHALFCFPITGVTPARFTEPVVPDGAVPNKPDLTVRFVSSAANICLICANNSQCGDQRVKGEVKDEEKRL